MAKTTLTSWILALALVATAGFAAAQGSSAPKKSSAQGAAKTTQAAPAASPTPAAQPTATPNPNFKTDKERQSYAVGMNIGESLHRQPVELDSNSLIQGLKDSMAGGKTLMTEDEAKASFDRIRPAGKGQTGRKSETSRRNQQEGRRSLSGRE